MSARQRHSRKSSGPEQRTLSAAGRPAVDRQRAASGRGNRKRHRTHAHAGHRAPLWHDGGPWRDVLDARSAEGDFPRAKEGRVDVRRRGGAFRATSSSCLFLVHDVAGGRFRVPPGCGHQRRSGTPSRRRRHRSPSSLLGSVNEACVDRGSC